jgi:hypothetical protein
MNRTGIALAALALTLTLHAARARADGDYLSPTDERFRATIGLLRAGSSTTLQVDGSNGTPGTFIDGENDLGLDRKRYLPRFEVMVRAGSRHRIWVDYFGLDRSVTTTLTSSALAFHDSVLQKGFPVTTDLSLRAFGLNYGYSFVKTQRFEVAGTFAVDAVDISARVRQVSAAGRVDSSENLAGPFPTPGIAATWVLSRRFYLDGRAQYLKVAIDHIDGSMAFYEFNALYRLRPNVSFALGYDAVKANLASTKVNQAGEFSFSTRGPQILVRVAF